jgi:hypothetical protein
MDEGEEAETVAVSNIIALPRQWVRRSCYILLSITCATVDFLLGEVLNSMNGQATLQTVFI